MSGNLEDKEQTYRIRFRNSRATEITFGTEPDGWYSGLPSKASLDVVFTQSKDTELGFYLDEKGGKDDFTITLSIMSQIYIYEDDEQIYPSWQDPRETKGNNSATEKQEFKFRFVNECESEVTFGLEPWGLFYSIPSKSHLDIFFSQKENDQLIVNIDHDSTVILDLYNILSVYIDDDIYLP